MAHEITGVNVAQKKGKQTVSLKLAKREEKTWPKLLDDRQHATESSHIASTKEIAEDDTAKTANSKVQESIKGLNDKHSRLEIKQVNVTDRHQCVISTIHRRTDRSQKIPAKARVNTQGKGKANT